MEDNELEEIREYVKENVWRFSDRYDLAWELIGMYRCPLAHADEALFDDIRDAVCDWCTDNDKDPDDYDIEEIFG